MNLRVSGPIEGLLTIVVTVDGTNPAPVDMVIKYPISHYSQGFIHSKWCKFLPSTISPNKALFRGGLALGGCRLKRR